jgi:lysozyme family protein
MSHFDAAVEFVLLQESPHGELAEDPRDPGGLTRWGICKRYHPDVDVANLTREGAVGIYQKMYWDESWEALPPGLALAALDCSVNQGPSIAHQFLIISKQDLKTFLALRVRRYSLNTNWETYGLGWTKRILSCLQAAITLT